MSKSNKKDPLNKYIAIEDLAHDLGLLDSDVTSWVTIDHPEVTYDHRNRPCICICFLNKYSQCEKYLIALRNSIEAQINQSATYSNQSAQLIRKREDQISSYERSIKKLEDLHRKYIHIANSHGFESAVMAAYLLFGRAINLLNMGCLCMKHGYWYSASVLRDIDETLDVALYFVITNDTDEGKTARHCWFRQNKTPKHSVCRSKIAHWHTSLIPYPGENNFKELKNELYQKKSKWTHPTFGVIREATVFEIDSHGNTRVVNMEYSASSLEHKLHEMSSFFRSSVLTAFQTFFLCFKQAMPLEDQDAVYVMTQIRNLQQLDKFGL